MGASPKFLDHQHLMSDVVNISPAAFISYEIFRVLILDWVDTRAQVTEEKLANGSRLDHMTAGPGSKRY